MKILKASQPSPPPLLFQLAWLYGMIVCAILITIISLFIAEVHAICLICLLGLKKDYLAAGCSPSTCTRQIEVC